MRSLPASLFTDREIVAPGATESVLVMAVYDLLLGSYTE
jgi:hypothetical protein